MSVSIDWFGFAEDTATDARGALTLVGFSPVNQVYPRLPADVSLSLVLSLMDDGEPEPTLENQLVTLDLKIIGPSGSIIVGAQQSSNMGERPYGDGPGLAMLVSSARFRVESYGRHTAEVFVTIGDTGIKLSKQRSLYINQE